MRIVDVSRCKRGRSSQGCAHGALRVRCHKDETASGRRAARRRRRREGDADRFRAIYEEYRKAPDVTETRLYLETMESILPGLKKYIIKSDAKGNLLNVLNLEGVIGGRKEAE